MTLINKGNLSRRTIGMKQYFLKDGHLQRINANINPSEFFEYLRLNSPESTPAARVELV